MWLIHEQRQSNPGNPIWKNLVKVNQYASCSQSSAESIHDCYQIIDGDLSTYWSTTTSSLGEWVRIEFTKLLEVHAVELWSKKNGPQGQCRELIFTFSNNVNEKVSFV